MRSKRKTGVLQERKWKLARFAHAVHTSANRSCYFREVFRAPLGEFLPFDVSPKRFDRVQIRCVAGQSLHGEPGALSKEVFLHDLALVGGQAVPHQNRLSPSQLFLQVFQEADEAFGVVASLPGLKEKSAAPPIAAVAEGGAHRHLRPIEGVDQNRGFPFRGPGAADGRALGDAALVLEEDPGLATPSGFFTAGHRSAFHTFTFSLSRSRAWQAGRCKVHSIEPRIFQTWPG